MRVELSDFHEGEPEALFEAVESAFDPVWHLARQGFTCVQEGVRVYVRAADDLDVAAIAQRVGAAVGDVELILSLRQTQKNDE